MLGPAGTFSDRAASAYCRRMFGAGTPPEVVHTRTIEEALANAAGDPASVAIVPIENSETGTVIPTQEQLRTAPVTIELELSIPVRYSLISHAAVADVRQALLAVGLLEDMLDFPAGLHTQLGTGGSPLSLGQAERLMLARAIAGSPRLLVLDEVLDDMDQEVRHAQRHTP